MSARAVDAVFIGIDPGPTPGMVVLQAYPNATLAAVSVVQCTADLAEGVLRELVGNHTSVPGTVPVVQIEKFVVGHRATRSSSAAAGAETRRLVDLLTWTARDLGAHVETRTASEAKQWASNARLEASGLWNDTAGLRHARDAARHALHAAVRHGGLADPLSPRWSR